LNLNNNNNEISQLLQEKEEGSRADDSPGAHDGLPYTYFLEL
jgi:hypothetical protein